MQQHALRVFQLVSLLREVIESHEFFSDLWVQGEVSNYTRSTLGHRYFSLKDERAVIRCVLFRDDLPGLELKEGEHVIAHGRVGVYVQRGELQFKPDFIRPEGIGILAARFEQLKQKLDSEGLFDPQRKRPLPAFPQRIGVVTSRTGAALQDIQNVLSHRWPAASLIVAPALVQGPEAAPRIVAALQTLARHRPPIDVAILARGGGSIEDLWPFNDERVARAIFGFPVPIVSGVGHETDITIADLVADLRAPTPSAAAAAVAPDVHDVRRHLARTGDTLAGAAAGRLAHGRAALRAAISGLVRGEPPVGAYRRDLLARTRALDNRLADDMSRRRAALDAVCTHLAAVDPHAVLRRGFAIVQKEDGRKRPIVTSVRRVRGGDRLAISVGDGAFWAEVS